MRTSRLHLVLTAAMVTLLTASCAPASPSPGGTPASPAASAASTSPTATSPQGTRPQGDLSGTHWVLAELGGQPPLAGTTVTAAFTGEGSVAGSGGCNRYRGAVSASEGAITVDEAVAMTMMACDEPIMTQEAAFLEALRAARSYTLADNELRLTDADGAQLARFTAQPQELAGTSWQVTAYNDGRSAVVSLLSGTTVTADFGTDGKVSGTGGCNRFTGGFTLDGTGIAIGPLAGTRMACAEPAGVMEQEAAFMKALESAATFVLEGESLTLRDASDAIAIQLSRGEASR